MEAIELDPQDRDFVERQLQTGEYDDAASVVHAALQLLGDVERARDAWLAEMGKRHDELRSGQVSALSLDEARLRTREHQRNALDRDA